MGRNILAVLAAVLIAIIIFSRYSAASTSTPVNPTYGGSGAVNAHVRVVPTIRSVTVSPGQVTFGGCTGGQAPHQSTPGMLGYPNGTCMVGSLGPDGKFPITVTYTGLPGHVYVESSGASPGDDGSGWTLCRPGGQPACTGGQGKPGADQYLIKNFADQVAEMAILAGTPACDGEFDAGGGCTATPAELRSVTQREGIELVGPQSWADHSTSFGITITWIAGT